MPVEGAAGRVSRTLPEIAQPSNEVCAGCKRARGGRAGPTLRKAATGAPPRSPGRPTLTALRIAHLAL
jgi:hypothetical protein